MKHDKIAKIELLFVSGERCPFRIKFSKPGDRKLTRECYPSPRTASSVVKDIVEKFFEEAEQDYAKSGQTEQATKESSAGAKPLPSNGVPGSREDKGSDVQTGKSS